VKLKAQTKNLSSSRLFHQIINEYANR